MKGLLTICFVVFSFLASAQVGNNNTGKKEKTTPLTMRVYRASGAATGVSEPYLPPSNGGTVGKVILIESGYESLACRFMKDTNGGNANVVIWGVLQYEAGKGNTYAENFWSWNSTENTYFNERFSLEANNGAFIECTCIFKQ